MGSEGVVMFIHKLGAENRPGVILTLRFLYLQTKKPMCSLNRSLGETRVDRDALEKFKIICTFQESKHGNSILLSDPVPIFTVLYRLVGGLHING
jgi:hypothetical protein